ncbi:hypothetical protein IKQ21_02395 [bacterium]|nr:hypothetical protein [bacterium]
MKIEELWNNAANRYSFNSIIWMVLLVVITAILCVLYIFIPHLGGESRTIVFLFLITGFPAVFVPLIILLTIYTFEILYKKENKNVKFRIKNHLLTNVCNKKYVFAISFIILKLNFDLDFNTYIIVFQNAMLSFKTEIA